MIISIETTKAPYVPESERLVVDDLGYEDDGISHLTARYGFQDSDQRPAPPRPRRGNRAGGRRSTSTAPSTSSPRSRSRPTAAPGMSGWRKRLFVAISRNAASPVDYFHLPGDRTVTLGSRIEL